jgi:hypothetical protein
LQRSLGCDDSIVDILGIRARDGAQPLTGDTGHVINGLARGRRLEAASDEVAQYLHQSIPR